MKNKQGFVIPIVIAIVAILAIGGGIYAYNKNKEARTTDSNYDLGLDPYYWSHPASDSKPENQLNTTSESNRRATTSLPVSLKQDSIWKTYSNTEYGISFKYPKELNLEERIYKDNESENLSLTLANFNYKNISDYQFNLPDKNSIILLINVSELNKNAGVDDTRMHSVFCDEAQKGNYLLGGKLKASKHPTEFTDGGNGTGVPDAQIISACSGNISYAITFFPYKSELLKISDEIMSTFAFTSVK